MKTVPLCWLLPTCSMSSAERFTCTRHWKTRWCRFHEKQKKRTCLLFETANSTDSCSQEPTTQAITRAQPKKKRGSATLPLISYSLNRATINLKTLYGQPPVSAQQRLQG